MNFTEVKDHLDTLSLALALWWVMENMADDDAAYGETFFYLRERVREEQP